MTRRVVVPRSAEDYALMVNMNAGIDVEKQKAELIRCSCPYGKSGDIIWVRESFARVNGEIAFKANEAQYKFAPGETKGLWKPSIHMPKAVARIWLEVKNTRVERLYDITEEDAKAEGVANGNIFRSLWQQINGNWNDNPCIWVISFKVLSNKGKPDFNKAKNYDFNCRTNLNTSHF